MRIRSALGILALATLVACGDEVVLQPIVGSACSAGRLQAGEIVDGDFSIESCVLPFHFWSQDQVPYVGYRVDLERGKGYEFRLRQRPGAEGLNNVDALLALFGKDENGASIPLAVGDDEAGGFDGRDAEFYFIAPRSGTFNLVVSSYAIDRLGGYRLSMRECPVVAMIETSGFHGGLPVAASDCTRTDFAQSGEASSIVLVGIEVRPLEVVQVAVSSLEFAPRVEMGGPGFDVFNNIFDETDFDSSVDDPAQVTTLDGGDGGVLTLAVGAEEFEATGTFRVEVLREPGTAVLRASAPGTGQPSMRSSSKKR
jgi:hypothetical protein